MRAGGIFRRLATACRRAKIERPARWHTEQGLGGEKSPTFGRGCARNANQLLTALRNWRAGALFRSNVASKQILKLGSWPRAAGTCQSGAFPSSHANRATGGRPEDYL
jgi:hypothetical protein